MANKVGDAANHLLGCFDAGANTLTGLAGNDTYYAARGMGIDSSYDALRSMIGTSWQ